MAQKIAGLPRGGLRFWLHEAAPHALPRMSRSCVRPSSSSASTTRMIARCSSIHTKPLYRKRRNSIQSEFVIVMCLGRRGERAAYLVDTLSPNPYSDTLNRLTYSFAGRTFGPPRSLSAWSPVRNQSVGPRETPRHRPARPGGAMLPRHAVGGWTRRGVWRTAATSLGHRSPQASCVVAWRRFGGRVAGAEHRSTEASSAVAAIPPLARAFGSHRRRLG